MAVQCLTENIKASIAQRYVYEQTSLVQLAKLFNTSPRTVGRVLEEYGLHTPVPRIQEEAKLVLDILRAYKVSPDSLSAILHEHTLRRRKQETSTRAIPALLRPSPSSISSSSHA